MRLILASASPRRRSLLQAAGLSFSVEPADVDETLAPDVEPLEAAVLLARRKADAVAERHVGEEVWVVGADTVVAVEVDAVPPADPADPEDPGDPGDRESAGPSQPGERVRRLLGKPQDEAQARRFLGLLSGSRHQVVTGVAVRSARSEATIAAPERTWVTMRPIRPDEVEAYVASGEWRDKAGGYAIQENADAFVTELAEGGFDNVVGLPVQLTLQLLAQAGYPA